MTIDIQKPCFVGLHNRKVAQIRNRLAQDKETDLWIWGGYVIQKEGEPEMRVVWGSNGLSLFPDGEEWDVVEIVPALAEQSEGAGDE